MRVRWLGVGGALALIAVLLLLTAPTGSRSPSGEGESVNLTELGAVSVLRVTVLVDNYPGREGLRTAWGFAALVEAGGVKILFDAGPDPKVLEHNARELGVTLDEVDFVVLSHHHGDHAGGLPYLASVNPGVTVYAPGRADPGVVNRLGSMGLNVIELTQPTVLAPGVMTTGSLWGPPAEHGLIVNVSGLGVVLITGCAHPRVEVMAVRAANLTGEPIYAVLGGFHLVSASYDRLEIIAKTFESLGVELVAPMHCSGDRARAYFKSRMPSAYVDGHVGTTFVFSSEGVAVSP